MFKPIEITTDGYENITLFDTHDITIHRKVDSNNAELVIHPCTIGKLSIRFAKEPYKCRIYLADTDIIDIDLADTDDWGNIQEMTGLGGEIYKEGANVIPRDWYNRIGWGNDEDGHIEIFKVELQNGTEIPLEEFKQDVKDFIIYHEG